MGHKDCLLLAESICAGFLIIIMAEYVVLAKQAYFVARDVYYVSRWVYRTVQTASHHETELLELRGEVDAELFAITGWANEFLREIDLETPGQAMPAWLPRVAKVYADVQAIYKHSDYNSRALLEDSEYREFFREYSKYLKDSTQAEIDQGTTPWLLEAPTTEEVEVEFEADNGEASGNVSQSVIAQPAGPDRRNTSGSSRFKGAIKNLANGFKFAVWDKPKLQDLRDSLRPRRMELYTTTAFIGQLRLEAALRSIMPLHAANTQQQEIIANNLGMRTHLGIRAITRGSPSGEASADLRLDIPEPREFQDYNIKPSHATILCKGELIKGESSEDVLVEYKSLPRREMSEERQKSEEQIKLLAKVLSAAGAGQMHTLRVKGYLMQEDKCAMIFEFPNGCDKKSEPISLLDMIEVQRDDKSDPHASAKLAASTPKHRHRLAHIAAQCIAAFHEDGWVHEGICSDSIVFFNNTSQQPICDRPYFVNFDSARLDSAEKTNYAALKIVKRRFYQHPDRLRANPVKFNPEHDLYALGVLLLELGMWKPAEELYKEFVVDTTKQPSPTAATETLLAPQGNGEGNVRGQAKDLPSGEQMRKTFEGIAKHELVTRMGTDYSRAVRACLSNKQAQKLLNTNDAQSIICQIIDLVKQ